MLDNLIYHIGAIILALSLINRRIMLPALLLCLTFLVNELTFNINPTWTSLEHRSSSIALVNFIVGIALCSRLKTPEIILGLIFIVCSFYHQFMYIEIQNRGLALKHFRSDFMAAITALEFATMLFILSGGQSNGGKRAKHYLPIVNRGLNRFFHSPAFKVAK